MRLALAETRLVNETREYLLANGICLDVFSRPAAKRSNTIIIIKNLPAKTDTDELERMFARHGSVKQILMPPGKLKNLYYIFSIGCYFSKYFVYHY